MNAMIMDAHDGEEVNTFLTEAQMARVEAMARARRLCLSGTTSDIVDLANYIIGEDEQQVDISELDELASLMVERHGAEAVIEAVRRVVEVRS